MGTGVLQRFEFEIHARDAGHVFTRKGDPFDRFRTVIWLSPEGDPPFVCVGFDDVEDGHPSRELARDHIHLDIVISIWKDLDTPFGTAEGRVYWDVMNRGAWRHRIFYEGRLILDYPGTHRRTGPVVAYAMSDMIQTR
jgi:hypothetical protein